MCDRAIIEMFSGNYGKHSIGMIDATGKSYNDAGKWVDCRYLPPEAGAHYCLASIKDTTVGQTAHIGLCFPNVCSGEELSLEGSLAFEYATRVVGIRQSVSVFVDCSNSKTKWDGKAIFAFLLLCILVTLCLVATVMDICLQRHEKALRERRASMMPVSVQNQDYVPLPDKAEDHPPAPAPAEKKKREPFIIAFLNCFRVNHNLHRLVVQTPIPNLTALNGLRGMALMGIILGHTHLYLLNVGITNPYYAIFRVSTRWGMAGMTGCELFVDIFFFLSGFLVAWGALTELAKRGRINWGLYYFHRVWRLTPALAFTMLIYIALTPYAGEGPLWNRYQRTLGFPNTEPENTCSKYWWTVLVYISNFYPTHFENQCFKWGWYLANDTQFYVISPIFLLAYHKSKRLGWFITVGTMFLCMVLRLIIVRAYDVSLNPGHTDAYMDYLYGKPYARLPSYLVGFVTAYIYLQVGPDYRMPRWLLRIGSLVAFVTLVCVWYGKYNFFQTPPSYHWSRTRNDMFIIFSRILAAAGAAWFMFISFIGDGGLVRAILGAPIWAGIGRLTYNGYLIHPALISLLYFAQNTFYTYSPLVATYLYTTHVVLTFAFALILYLLIEKPMMSLESVLFHGGGGGGHKKKHGAEKAGAAQHNKQ